MERILSVKHLEDFRLEIQFKDGLRAVVDIQPYISTGISLALRDKAFFQQVALESSGGICWPNGFDFCPNFLRTLAAPEAVNMA